VSRIPSNGEGWQGLESEVDAPVEELIRDSDLPGVSIAVTKEGRLLLAKGYGHAFEERGSSIPMTPTTRVMIGSVTKAVVTGPATWQLLGSKSIDPATTRLYGPNGLFDGRFDRDIDIGVKQGVDEGEPGADQWKEWYGKITLQHLFDHRAGFTRSGDTDGAAEMFDIPVEECTYEHVHRHFLRTRPLLYEPGTDSKYANHGIGMLTLVVEHLSGESFPEYIRREYLKPLNLHHAIRPERANPDSCDAYRYKSNDRGAPEYYELADSGLGLAAGGFMASMPGLARVMVHLAETYTPTELDRMGWSRTSKGKLEHNGLLNGGTAYAAMFPDGYTSNSGADLSRVHVAVATNIRTSTSDLETLANKVVLAVAGSDVPDSYDIWKTGSMAGSCEYCRHGVPAAEYQAVFKEATEAGYRLEWIDGYTVKGAVHFNVVFRTNASSDAWVSHHDMTGTDYQQRFDQYASAGYALDHVDSYAVGKSVRYAAIWRKSGETVTAYHGKSATAHQASFDSLVENGWRPTVISVASVGGGRRYTALYTKAPVGSFIARSALTPAQYQDAFEENADADRHLRYLNSYVHDGEPWFSAIWTSKPRVASHRARHGLTDEGYRDAWRSATSAGLHTDGVTGYEDGSGVRFAAFWTA
jgi:CubicO group peptidase (beta-lactamase class C family)